MVNTSLYNEEKNKKKGLRVSITIHILLLLIALYPILKDDPNQSIDKQYAVAITFTNDVASNSFKGRAAEGRQRPENNNIDRVKPAPVKKIQQNNSAPKVKKPDISVPKPQTPSAPVQSDIYEDDTDIFAVEDVPQAKTTETKHVPDSPPEKVTPVNNTNDNDDIEDVPVQVPSSAGNTASDIGNNTSSPSNKKGSGTGQGKKGKGNGRDKSGNDSTSGVGTGGPGHGAYDGSGDGIFGRHAYYRPKMKELKLNVSGKIAFKVCIDRKGRTTFVQLKKSGTTIRNKEILRKAVDYLWGFKWEEDAGAPAEQCGHYTLIIENNTVK